MFHLDWHFFPVSDSVDLGTEYVGAYDPALVAISVVIAILAAFVALSISGRIVAAQTERSRWAWTSAGAVVMGSGIWAMHFIGMLAFSLPCGVGSAIALFIPGFGSALPTTIESTPAFSAICRAADGLVRISVSSVAAYLALAWPSAASGAAVRPVL